MSTTSWDGNHLWATALHVPEGHPRLHVHSRRPPLPGSKESRPTITCPITHDPGALPGTSVAELCLMPTWNVLSSAQEGRKDIREKIHPLTQKRTIAYGGTGFPVVFHHRQHGPSIAGKRLDPSYFRRVMRLRPKFPKEDQMWSSYARFSLQRERRNLHQA